MEVIMENETTKETFSSKVKKYFAAENFFSAKNVTYFAVLLALVIVLQIFASAIPVGATGATLNFSLVPIVLGAILLGPVGGMLLGLACGIVVLVQVIVLTGNAFYLAIWTNSPVVTTFTCILKTTAAGLLAGIAYHFLSGKNSLVAAFVASAIVPVVNTGLFILGCLCMTGTIAEFGGGLSGVDILVFILVGLVSFNFFIELAINLILTPAIHRVVMVVEKQLGKQHKSTMHEEKEAQETENAEQAENNAKAENT